MSNFKTLYEKEIKDSLMKEYNKIVSLAPEVL